MVVSYYLQQQQEDDIEEERNETLHQTKLSSISFSHSVTSMTVLQLFVIIKTSAMAEF